MLDAKLVGLEGGSSETEAEALEAARASFWFLLKPCYLPQPFFVVVVAVNPLQANGFGMAFAFGFADVVFLARVDVGIEIKNGGADVVVQHPLDNGR